MDSRELWKKSHGPTALPESASGKSRRAVCSNCVSPFAANASRNSPRPSERTRRTQKTKRTQILVAFVPFCLFCPFCPRRSILQQSPEQDYTCHADNRVCAPDERDHVVASLLGHAGAAQHQRII